MEEKRTLVAANWKMHKTVQEAVRFVARLRDHLSSAPSEREVLIIPPYTALWPLKEAVQSAGFAMGAQNCHWETHGAYTGEVSTGMLRDVGCEYVLVGHSERRQLFGETDQTVAKKVDAVYREGLVPVLCVGERLEQREAGHTFQVVKEQLETAVFNLTADAAQRLVVAYEPVWAIGTGKTANPQQAQEVHAFLRETLKSRFHKTVANQIRIVYGGSVKPDNVDELMAQPDIDGLLVGGAALEVDSFSRIVDYQT